MTVTAEQIRPLPTRVLVRRVKKPDQTPSGIHLPPSVTELSMLGEVVAIGDDVTTVQKGQIIVFSEYAARPCIATTERDDLLFVSERDVFAIIE